MDEAVFEETFRFGNAEVWEKKTKPSELLSLPGLQNGCCLGELVRLGNFWQKLEFIFLILTLF